MANTLQSYITVLQLHNELFMGSFEYFSDRSTGMIIVLIKPVAQANDVAHVSL